jgi:hypothetical protein
MFLELVITLLIITRTYRQVLFNVLDHGRNFYLYLLLLLLLLLLSSSSSSSVVVVVVLASIVV